MGQPQVALVIPSASLRLPLTSTLAIMTIQSADFAVSVSATDFVAWKGEGDADYIGNPFLVQVLNLLTIPADPAALYEKYFELPVVGNGDVLFYKSTFNGESIFAVNMYRDMYDQLDILTFGVRTKKNAMGVRVALRAFFDSAQYQVHYEEGGILSSVSSLIDSYSYPKTLAQGGYVQRMVVVHNG